MGINKVFLSGNLTRDPELRATASGTQVLEFRLAVNERVRNQQTDAWEDRANFFSCIVFGRRAEALARRLAKGAKVSIEGSLRYSAWERDGVKRSKVEVVVDELEFMSSAGSNGQAPMDAPTCALTGPDGDSC
ncbi:single-stranded DNA-binding protein [Enorma phocaeensis]|uniref:Single-stranded DNA-binding protein n=1 Tax=Enorma phocaeensis TaxID=1871019 RepID=A0A921ITR4_9ACTN|nr:single-stranded DNA-binding protein [Enorma phocaeensis]HJG36700.1 single-stranded DNA-binding protein [Enorma phocaeensis]